MSCTTFTTWKYNLPDPDPLIWFRCVAATGIQGLVAQHGISKLVECFAIFDETCMEFADQLALFKSAQTFHPVRAALALPVQLTSQTVNDSVSHIPCLNNPLTTQRS